MSDLDKLLTLYHPSTPRGNYQSDVAHRGGNRVLARVIVLLSLATMDEVEYRFRALDEAHDDRIDRAIERANEQARASTEPAA